MAAGRPHPIVPTRVRFASFGLECIDCGGKVDRASALAALAGEGTMIHEGGDLVACPGFEQYPNREGKPLFRRECTQLAEHEGEHSWGYSFRIDTPRA